MSHQEQHEQVGSPAVEAELPAEARVEAVAAATGAAVDEASAGVAPSWTDGAGGRVGQLRGALGLLRDGIDGVTCLVRDVHLAIARRPFEVLSYAAVVSEKAAAVSEGAEAVRPLYEGGVGAVYGSVRLVNRLVCAGLDGALAVAEGQPAAKVSP